MPENTRGPKIHPANLNAKATDEANLAGMIASGQPWQDDCGGYSTAELLDASGPVAVEAVSVPVVDVEPVAAPVVAEKPAARTKKAKK